MKNELGELILRFLRTVLSADLVIAVLVGLACYFLDFRNALAYGTLLVWAGAAIFLFAALTGVGGFASRAQDAIAYSRSGAGNMLDNLHWIADARSSNLGCFVHMLVAALILIGLGELIQVISALWF